MNTDLGAILGFTSAELDQEYYLFGLRLAKVTGLLPYITIGLGSLDADLSTNLGLATKALRC